MFCGKALTEMDLTAAKVTRRLLYGNDCDGAVRASLDKVDFKKPAHLVDIIELTATIKKLGRTSIKIFVNVLKETQIGNIESICHATFNFCLPEGWYPIPTQL